MSPIFCIRWPWDWTHTPVYEVMYIYLFYASVLTQIGIPSVDALFLDFYLHVSLMFDVICVDLKSLVEDVVGKYEGCLSTWNQS